MTFAEWVRETRESKRMTKVECARRAGVSQPVWTEYENTDKIAQPRRETVAKIAAALGVTLEEALLAAGYEQSLKPEHEIQMLFFGLTPEQTKILLNVARATREALVQNAA